MTRTYLDYTAQRAPVAAQGFNPDVPIAGFYKTRLRSGAVLVGVRIWFGAPLDPVTGEELDRSPRWQAMANDAPIDLEQVWPKCADEPCDAAEYRRLCGLQDWARTYSPAAADPRRRLNPLSTPILF